MLLNDHQISSERTLRLLYATMDQNADIERSGSLDRITPAQWGTTSCTPYAA